MAATTKPARDGSAAVFTARMFDDGAAISPMPVLGDGTGVALAKAEDSAATSGDFGIPILAVQTATPADAATNGDYAMLQIKDGRLYVQATIKDISSGEYETVAASATAQVLGATGAAGDYISGVLVIPATTSPGNVLLLDNATSITVFAGGAASVSNLVPFFIPLGMYSVSGAWKLTTGSNVSCIGIGNFT